MAGLLRPTPAAEGAPAPQADLDTLLAAELARWASTPFDLAADNCGLAVLRFAEKLSGAVPLRGRRIMGARRAARLMAEPEAFVAVADAILQRIGWIHVTSPARGDVGLVEQPDRAAPLIAAICVEDGGAVPLWAARGNHAVVIQPARPLIVWRR